MPSRNTAISLQPVRGLRSRSATVTCGVSPGGGDFRFLCLAGGQGINRAEQSSHPENGSERLVRRSSAYSALCRKRDLPRPPARSLIVISVCSSDPGAWRTCEPDMPTASGALDGHSSRLTNTRRFCHSSVMPCSRHALEEGGLRLGACLNLTQVLGALSVHEVGPPAGRPGWRTFRHGRVERGGSGHCNQVSPATLRGRVPTWHGLALHRGAKQPMPEI
jgi:hypothetical protein